jgi:hypothetical protein
VSLPAALAALTVKLNVFAVVGVPEITPAVERLKPVGNAPESMLHVIGVSPVAVSVWLYAVPTEPPANVVVVIVGATGAGAIVIENCLVSLPAALAALTVKLNVFAVVGVPEITPAVERLKPVGNAPESMLHVIGVFPAAARVWLYAVPTVPFGNDIVVITGLPADAIVIENCFVSFPAALVALTVKLNVPVVVGFPEIVPVVSEMPNPAGNVPLSRLHVIGVSPVAVSVWLYAVPTAPSNNDIVVIVGATGAGAIVIESDFVSFPVVLAALTVKLNVFAVVGVPEITPAVERLKPVGNAPESMLHVIGVSPVAARVWLYSVPTEPSGNVVVVIVGAVPPPPLSSSSQVANVNPITATNAIIPASLYRFFIQNSFCISKYINRYAAYFLPQKTENTP